MMRILNGEAKSEKARERNSAHRNNNHNWSVYLLAGAIYAVELTIQWLVKAEQKWLFVIVISKMFHFWNLCTWITTHVHCQCMSRAQNEWNTNTHQHKRLKYWETFSQKQTLSNELSVRAMKPTVLGAMCLIKSTVRTTILFSALFRLHFDKCIRSICLLSLPTTLFDLNFNMQRDRERQRLRNWEIEIELELMHRRCQSFPCVFDNFVTHCMYM